MIRAKIEEAIRVALADLGLGEIDFTLEHPENPDHGDYSTNAALVAAKKTKGNPLEIAGTFRVAILARVSLNEIERIEIAGQGFINFFLSKNYLSDNLKTIIADESYGKGGSLEEKKIIIEYTDANPFKELHIGHLMSNTIGEALSRLIGWGGAEVKRACYQGDIGLHVAYAVAYKLREGKKWQNIQDIASSYSLGVKRSEENEEFRNFVAETNRKIYRKDDQEVNETYNLGREISLKSFESVYEKLGTKFDYFFFESTTGEFGKTIVRQHIPDIFEESEGAVIYKGEKRDTRLHTRVFINKDGLPTYEAKELGLTKIKYDTFPYDKSVVVTGNEINDYFRVVLSAMKEVFPKLAEKTEHISHGMLRLPTGKMSSRSGEIISAEELIDEVSKRALNKIEYGGRKIENKDKLAEEVAVGAIKYSILKQAIGRDIVFDFDKSLSFEGDSGPYLQYTFARTNSVLEKASKDGVSHLEVELPSGEIVDLIRKLHVFPEIIERSLHDFAPNYLVTYLTELASIFNKFYAEYQIIDSGSPEVTSKRLMVTKAVNTVLKNGLSVLGIAAPDRM